MLGVEEDTDADNVPCNSGCAEGPVALAPLEVAPAAVTSNGNVSSAEAGWDSDAKVLFAWSVMGTMRSAWLCATKTEPELCCLITSDSKADILDTTSEKLPSSVEVTPPMPVARLLVLIFPVNSASNCVAWG
jgi:hypothetical protein